MGTNITRLTWWREFQAHADAVDQAISQNTRPPSAFDTHDTHLHRAIAQAVHNG